MKRSDRHPLSDGADGQLTERIKASDQRAFGELVDSMEIQLIRLAVRYTGQGKLEDAKDIVQEAWANLWEKRHTLDSKRTVRGLIYTMVQNLSINFYKRKQRRAGEPLPAHGVPDLDVLADKLLDDKIVRKHMARWVEDLTPLRRTAFVLSRVDGLTHKQIAKKMGIKPATVNSHITAALKELRLRFNEL